MSEGRNISGAIFGTLVLALASPAFGWASRTVEPGDPAPEIVLRDVSGQELVLSDHRGEAVLLVFWAEKNPVMKRHSWEVLAASDQLGRRFAADGLRVFSIQFPPLGGADREALIAEHGLAMPMLLAPDRSVYSAYGLFLLPTVVLLDRDHRVREVVGYAAKMEHKLEGAAALMLGLKSETEVRSQLQPQRTVVSDAKKQALRHFNLGRKLLEKGRLDEALEELGKALAADPESSDALFAEAEIYLRQEKAEEALRLSEAGLDLAPDDRRGILINARALAATGSSAEALEILSELGGNDRLHAEALVALGDIHRRAGAKEDALEAFSRALRILLGNP